MPLAWTGLRRLPELAELNRHLLLPVRVALMCPLGHHLLLTARSHVWRTTLNSEWADLGVSAERRAAYFGHSPEINRQAYTDLVDLEELANTVEGRM